jgi:hypothetical protein
LSDFIWPFAAGDRNFAPDAFDEAIEFNVELTTSRSGRVTTLSLPGARWRCVMRFPDASVAYLVQRRQLEAFFASMRGGADRLLLWNLLTPEPLGNMRGTVTLAASVAAGASTAQITGGLAKPNLLRNSSFENDSNSDGLADDASVYYDVLPANFSKSRVAGNGSAFAQRVSGDVASGSSIGVLRSLDGITPGTAYSLSCDINSNTAGMASQFYIGWYTAGSTFISDSTGPLGAPFSFSWNRRSFTAIAPPGAAIASVYAWFTNTSGSLIVGANCDFDNIQFEAAASATPYAGLPTLLRGDRISFGGQRVMLTADATANDAGTVTVSFQPAHRAGAASGAALTLVKPTTKYVLAQPVVQMAATGNNLPGFAVELVEE